jgi:DNA-binding FrmR family transcriptional regulator
MADHHPDHSSTSKRLNRIEGQISGIRKMIEDRRYCLDILAQTKSVQAALKSLEAEILETHIEHCVKDAMTSGDMEASRTKISEILQIFKRR